jgi:hypothetical protein
MKKMQIKKPETENNEYNVNILLSKKHKLFENLYHLNSRINSSNKKELNDKKNYFFTQYKYTKNAFSLNIKNRLSNIKSISYKKLFKINESKNNNDFINKDKNKIPKLYLLKSIKENNNFNFFDSIISSSRKNTRNYFPVEKHLSTNLTINKKNSNRISPINIYKSKNKLINNIYKNNSQREFFFNQKNIINYKSHKTTNKKIGKNCKHFSSSDKICTTSNCCDASTNTLSLVSLQNYGFIKKYKRPLMIDYFYSEHKKFCYGFDKLKGKNKYKKPFFIVHKY